MKYEHILVPLDGTKFAESVLPHAVLLAHKFGAVCHLMRAVPEYSYAPIGVLYPGAVPLGMVQVESPATRTARDLASAKDYLDEVQERLASQGVKSTKTVLQGVAEKTIVEFAEEKSLDLILIASHQRSGLSRLLAPNTSTVVSIEATCPVMVIRGTQGESPFGELTLVHQLEEYIQPLVIGLSKTVSCPEEMVQRAIPKAITMLLTAVAEKRHRGPRLKQLFEQARTYSSVAVEPAAYLRRVQEEPPLKLVSYLFHERGAWAASTLAQDVDGLETDQSLGLLAALSPLVLTYLEGQAKHGSTLRATIEEEMERATPEVQEVVEKTSHIVGSV